MISVPQFFLMGSLILGGVDPQFTSSNSIIISQNSGEKSCQTLSQEISQVLGGVKVNFPPNSQGNSSSQTCELTISGTGKNLPSVSVITQKLNQLLTNQGWKLEKDYSADGVEGSIRSYNKSNLLAVFNVESQLDKSVNCPNGTVLSTCYAKAKPQQILYKIKLVISSSN